MNKERLQIFSILFAGLMICAAMILSEHLAPPFIEVQVTEASSATAEAAEKLNLNTATLEELMSIKGIGTVTAQRILDYRTTYGSFRYLEELMNVRGIGTGKYEDIADFLTVD